MMPRTTDATKRARATLMLAKFDSICPSCSLMITKGDPIVLLGRESKGNGARHPLTVCLPSGAHHLVAGFGSGSASVPPLPSGTVPAPGASQGDPIVAALRVELAIDRARLAKSDALLAEERSGLAKAERDKAAFAQACKDRLKAAPVMVDAGAIADAVVERMNRKPSAAAPDIPAPALDPTYVETDTGRGIRFMLETGRHFVVSGPSGSGKTFPIEQECARLKLPLLKLSCADGVTYADLVVRQELRKTNGSVETVAREGVLPRAMRAGCLLILDEGDQLPSELVATLHGPLETPRERASLFIPMSGETIVPAPGFIIAVTSNMLRDESGTYGGFGVPPALLSRLQAVTGDYLSRSTEKAILVKVGASELVADKLSSWLVDARKYYASGDLSAAPGTRTAVEVVGMTSGNGPTLTLPDALNAAYGNKLSATERATYETTRAIAGI